jgi:hypothetical protein
MLKEKQLRDALPSHPAIPRPSYGSLEVIRSQKSVVAPWKIYQRFTAKEYRKAMKAKQAAPLWCVIALLLTSCNALNPLCGSARPVPIIGSLSVNTIAFAQVQQGFLLTVLGSQFVSSSVVVINSTPLTTTVISSQQLQVTITTTLISGPGTASVTVNTPSGNSTDLGCTSGGTSGVLKLTIT